MIYITRLLIAGHDHFPEGMKKTGEFISGLENGIEICALNSDESTDVYKEKLQALIHCNSNEGIIIFCDLIGGTPFKVALQLSKELDKHIRIIAGINLPGLLTGIMLQDSMKVDELVEEIVKESSQGVKAL